FCLAGPVPVPCVVVLPGVAPVRSGRRRCTARVLAGGSDACSILARAAGKANCMISLSDCARAKPNGERKNRKCDREFHESTDYNRKAVKATHFAARRGKFPRLPKLALKRHPRPYRVPKRFRSCRGCLAN